MKHATDTTPLKDHNLHHVVLTPHCH